MISAVFATAFEILTFVLLIFVLLTWIPGINWNKEPFKSLRVYSDIFFGPFRKIVPPIGGVLDISPIIAFFALSLFANLVLRLLVYLGL